MTLPIDHPQVATPKIGVLLVNLGTPDAPTTSAVKRYLKSVSIRPPRRRNPTNHLATNLARDHFEYTSAEIGRSLCKSVDRQGVTSGIFYGWTG